MSTLKESQAIFKRNPLTSAFTLLLIIGASVGQVVSLSSLYPILQTLLSDQSGSDLTSGLFIALVAKFGAAPTLLNLLLLFLILGVGYSVLNWCADAFQNLQLRNFETAVRRELFESAVRAKWTYARDLRHGEFLNVITREANQYTLLIRHLLHTFGALLQFAALLAYAFYLNWQVTGLGVLMFSAGALVLAPMLKLATALGRKGTTLATNMSDRLVAALRSLKMVKALSLEVYLARTVGPSFEAVSSTNFRSNVLGSGQYAVMEIIAVVAVSSMLYIGLILLSTPKADLMVILLLLFRALPQVRLAIYNYHHASGYVPSMQVIRQHLSAAQKAETRRGGVRVSPDWKRIDLCNVSFAYEGRSIIDALSLSINRGEFWAIAGPSGIGKTTLLDLAIGLLEPQSGKVTIDGIAFNELDIESWHAQMAYLGQDAFAFAGTVRDNLVWGGDRQWPDAELLNALHAVKLLGVGVSGTEILNRDAGENGCNLSGGEKQRLALARLFLRQPSLMILDEPSTGLDASTEKDIFQSISSFFRKTTLIMVTHREELTRDADHIVRFVSDGIKVEAGAAVWTAGKP